MVVKLTVVATRVDGEGDILHQVILSWRSLGASNWTLLVRVTDIELVVVFGERL